LNRFEFQLEITPDEYLDYYRGVLRHVIVESSCGKTVQFPASLLQRFLTPEGIRGNFVLTCDAEFKNPSLQRVNAEPK
jgi:hypothetical protein